MEKEKKTLSKKQTEILNYLKDTITKKGYPPTVREIGQAVSLKSTSSVFFHLSALEEKGYIRKDPLHPRAIEILEDGFYRYASREDVSELPAPASDPSTVSIPILGQVAAGCPIYAEENLSGYFSLNTEFVPQGKEVFMLTVKGDSMINVGIYSGDQVIVEREQTASNGDLVVALVDDSATVKTFYKEAGHYRLQPENDTMAPIIVDHVEILGKVIGLFRSLR